ncbi:MAG: hypothetical protein WCA12_20830, partial [Burkholderiales bacterium]
EAPVVAPGMTGTLDDPPTANAGTLPRPPSTLGIVGENGTPASNDWALVTSADAASVSAIAVRAQGRIISTF